MPRASGAGPEREITRGDRDQLDHERRAGRGTEQDDSSRLGRTEREQMISVMLDWGAVGAPASGCDATIGARAWYPAVVGTRSGVGVVALLGLFACTGLEMPSNPVSCDRMGADTWGSLIDPTGTKHAFGPSVSVACIFGTDAPLKLRLSDGTTDIVNRGDIRCDVPGGTDRLIGGPYDGLHVTLSTPWGSPTGSLDVAVDQSDACSAGRFKLDLDSPWHGPVVGWWAEP